VGVDVGGTALQPTTDIGCPVEVGTPHRAAQAVLGGIGPLDGVIEVAVRDDWERRAELLLVDDADAVAHAGEDGRLEEVTVAVHRLAASHCPATSRKRVVDELLDALVLGTVVDRSDLDALTRPLADPYLPGACGEGLDQIIVQRFRHIYALDARADLAAVDERPQNISLAMAAGSASSRTIAASLPPSSKVTRLRSGAAAAAMALPVATDPVKLILRTAEWLVIQAPSSSPPLTTFTTPGGSRGVRISPSFSVASGVNGEGFSTTVFPASRAGPIFQAARSRG